MRDFYAKKYTILMNEEPIDIWIKNDEIKKSMFMNQKVSLDLNKETIAQIKDAPSKVVNGNNFTDNINFTKSVSKMMSQQLDMAMAKRDMKTLSRFARSDLVPASSKNKFIETISQPRGLRGLLVRAVNKTNSIFQKLANKIDRYFEHKKDNILKDSKIDKHLAEYQLKEFNKAPPLSQIDIHKRVNPKLSELAEDFANVHDIDSLSDSKINDKVLQNQFLEKTTQLGFSAIDSKTALAQIVKEKEISQNYKESLKNSHEEATKNLQAELKVFKIKEASKNENLSDFKTLTQDMNAVDKIDILIKNKEYLSMNETQKLETENKYLYAKEPLQERAVEAKTIAQVIDKPKEVQTVYERNSTLNFNQKDTKEQVSQKWSELQKINRAEQAQNRDFMNVSAVRFGGVSSKSLESWKNKADENGIDKEVTQKFVDATLRNARELTKIGILKETQGEFKFVDNFAKETLFKNLDQPVEKIKEANQGKAVQVEMNPKSNLQERVQDISSEKSFEKLLNSEGQIDSQKLHQFAEHLQNLATQLHTQEQANKSAITKDDVQLANRGSQQKVVGVENER